MIYQPGDRREPLNQHPIREPKKADTHRRWIVLTALDDMFRLTYVTITNEGVIDQKLQTPWTEYDRFFEELHHDEFKGKKWWLIGFRTRYALQQADLFQALETERIKLQPKKKGAKTKTYSGKVTISERTLEIDVQAGKVQIKLMDWTNYGVYCDETPTSLNARTTEQDVDALAGYLDSCHRAGITVSRPTAAQLGWIALRRVGLARALWRNDDASARKLERDAYFNGRCEPYQLGPIPGLTWALDVKACYATICRDRTVPIRMTTEYPAGLNAFEIAVDDHHHWIAEVILNTTEPDYPMRDAEGKVFYPVGQFVTTLTWPELAHALVHARVEQVLRAARYEAATALRPFAEWALEQRRRIEIESGPIAATPIKTIFNATLGFTARKAYEWVRIPNPVNRAWARGTIASPETDKPVDCMILDSHAAWLKTTGEPREAIPYLHATICAWARYELLGLIREAGRENVLYVDTDGMLVTQAGMERLAHQVKHDDPQAGDLVQRVVFGRTKIDHAAVFGLRR